MEDSRKKPIMIGVSVACLVLAGVITYKTRSGSSGGIESIKRGQMIWVKCNNPNCGAKYQIDRRDYLEYLQEYLEKLTRQHPSSMGILVPPLVCKACEEESVYKAVKCEKCGTVFFPGDADSRFEDKCPECGHSKIEQMKKAAQQGR